MEITLGSSFTVALLSCIYISLIMTPTVSAKCYGKWAIHACWGGNGKRSDPNLSPSSEKVRPSLLRQLLIKDVQRLSDILQSTDDLELPIGDQDLEARDFEPRSLNEQLVKGLTSSEEDSAFRGLPNYLRALKLRTVLRNTEDNMI